MNNYEYSAQITKNYQESARRMILEGGSFAGAIGEAFLNADYINASRLVQAFPDLFARFFPTTTKD